MAVPNSKTSNINAHNLVTTLDGAYQFAVWYGLDGELRVGRIERGVQVWGVDHDEHVIDGDARTELALPVEDDEHNFPCIAIDDQGFAHVWANMHNKPNRHIVSDGEAVSDITEWSAAPAMPSEIDRNTYPMPVMFTDGTLWFYYRAMDTYGLSGRANGHFWTRRNGAWSARTQLFQGVPTGEESSVNDYTNFSPYLCYPKLERRSGLADRLHLFWIWRQDGIQGTSCVLPSYAYTDDKGATWHAVDGSPLTLPIAPWNNLACQTGIESGRSRTITDAVMTTSSTTLTSATANFQPSDVGKFIRGQGINNGAIPPNTGQATTIAARASATSITLSQEALDTISGGSVVTIGDDYLNDPSLAIDADGRPHAFIGGAPLPRHHIHWDGNEWVHDLQPADLASFGVLEKMIPYYVRGELWLLSVGGPLNARRPRLWSADGQAQACMGGVVRTPTAGSVWDQMADPVAYGLFGSVEVLTPDGNTPRVAAFGRGLRVRPSQP